MASVDILREIDWNNAFADAMDEHEAVLRRDATRYLDRLVARASEVIDAWFDSDESLLQLEKDRLEPLLERETGVIMEESQHRMRALLAAPNAGAKFSPDEVGALITLDIDLNRRLLGGMDAVEATVRPPEAEVKIPSEQIPVRRTLSDFLFLRGGKRVRKALFGKAEAPAARMSPEQKEKRMGATGRQFLSDYVKDQMISSLVEHPREAGLEFLKAFVRQFQSMLEEILDEHREAALEELESARRAQRQHEIVERGCARLRSEFEGLRKHLGTVRKNHAPADESGAGEDTEA